MNARSPLTCPACGDADVVVFHQPASKFSSGGGVPGLRCNACGSRAVGRAFPGFTPPTGIPGIRPVPAPRRPTPSQPRPQAKRAEPARADHARTAPPAPKPAPRTVTPAAQTIPSAKVAKAAPAPKAEAAPASRPTTARAACTWKECDQPARPGSKYCSRNCSNKNARWRHRQRKTA